MSFCRWIILFSPPEHHEFWSPYQMDGQRQHSCWSQWRDGRSLCSIRCAFAEAQRRATSAVFRGFFSPSKDLHGCWIGRTTIYCFVKYHTHVLSDCDRRSGGYGNLEAPVELKGSRAGRVTVEVGSRGHSWTTLRKKVRRLTVRRPQWCGAHKGFNFQVREKVSKGGNSSCCVLVRPVHWFPCGFLGVSLFPKQSGGTSN